MSLELRVGSQNFAPVPERTSNRMTGVRERLQSREPLSSGPETEGSNGNQSESPEQPEEPPKCNTFE